MGGRKVRAFINVKVQKGYSVFIIFKCKFN